MGLTFLKSLNIKSLALGIARAIIKKHGHDLEQKAVKQIEQKLHALHDKAERAIDDGA